MDSLLQNPTGPLGLLGVIVLTVLYIYDRRKSGQDTIKESTIEGYKQQVQQLQSAQQMQREESAIQKEKISELTRAVGTLEGINSEKDKQIENLTKLVQGRNPEMLTLLTEMQKLMVKISTYMEQNAEAMAAQTKLLMENRDRYQQIDAAHAAPKHPTV